MAPFPFLLSQENFLSGKKIGGEFKIWRKLMECQRGRGRKNKLGGQFQGGRAKEGESIY
jgi:hypothetical protein